MSAARPLPRRVQLALANVFAAVAATFSGQGLRRAIRALLRLALRWKRVSRVLPLSGGAHPRFARNTGTGEPLATATQLVPTDIVIYHDQTRPSALLLPVTDTTLAR
jgi:hypothetical protein